MSLSDVSVSGEAKSADTAKAPNGASRGYDQRENGLQVQPPARTYLHRKEKPTVPQVSKKHKSPEAAATASPATKKRKTSEKPRTNAVKQNNARTSQSTIEASKGQLVKTKKRKALKNLTKARAAALIADTEPVFQPKTNDHVEAKNIDDDCWYEAIIMAVHNDENDGQTKYDIEFCNTSITLKGYVAFLIEELPAKPDDDEDYYIAANNMVLAREELGAQDFLPARVIEKMLDGELRIVFQHRAESPIYISSNFNPVKMHQGGPRRLLRSKREVWPSVHGLEERWKKKQAEFKTGRKPKSVPEEELNREPFDYPPTDSATGGGRMEGWMDLNKVSGLKRGSKDKPVIYAQLPDEEYKYVNGKLDASGEDPDIIAIWMAHVGELKIELRKSNIKKVCWQRRKGSNRVKDEKSSGAVFIKFVLSDGNEPIFRIAID